ncbi:MAG TPA: hypothetical protein VGF06_18795 [Terriglobales bacterium]|jgi:hypothetical protein
MAANVQARLDEESQTILRRLMRKTGWTASQVVRQGLRVLDACQPKRGKRRTIIGQGQFASGVGDLASNKAHMEGFGR